MELDLPDEAATEAFGRRLAEQLRPGDTVGLSGGLGAGKTTLARAVIRALTHPDEEVPSPTFTLVQGYEGRAFPVAHIDLYRVTSAAEAVRKTFSGASGLTTVPMSRPSATYSPAAIIRCCSETIASRTRG